MVTAQSTRSVRVRFAPSPTGFLHIGGVRTALFNWLYARHHKGQFLLRIEDTDLERSEKQYTQDILSSMKWLGLTWDEEPVYQSMRLEVYMQKALELVEKGHAYKCTCTEAEVEAMRERALIEGKKPQYDRRCRERKEVAPEGTPFVIRAKIPLEGYVEFTDLIRGDIRFENADLDDFVLIRSNGAPTYNLSVVVDDVYSQMTHIIRGDDHINNTPKQIHLYRFCNFTVPEFAHLPMILGSDKKKLSKRHGAVSANVYRAEGYLPETLLNFLARLGWSHGDQEIFSVQEMIEYFSFDHVQKSSAVFNSEKLLWLNGEHIRRGIPERLRDIVVEDFSHFFTPQGALLRADTALAAKLVALIQPKVKLVKEIAEQLVPLCTPGTVEVDASGLKWNKDPNLKAVVKGAISHLSGILAKKVRDAQSVRRSGSDSVWGQYPALGDIGMTPQDIDALLRHIGDQHGVKLGDLAQPMRLTVTGRLVSAGLFELLSVLPWDVVEARLRKIETL
jgi:glutamyl-tRNA synthetase